MQPSTFLLLLALTAYTSAQPAPPTGTPCKHLIGQSSCICQHPDGKIDLTSLANNGTASFTDIADNNGFTYSLNPCYKFSDGDCSDVYVCQKKANTYSVADAGEQIWIDNDGTTYVYYTGHEDRSTRVNLICDRSKTGVPEVTTSGDSIVQLSYVFNITSSRVCPGASGGGSGSGGDIAGPAGLVIIFILLGVLMTYFIVGALVMKFKYNAAGLDVVPQRNFWFALPVLIKDGVLLTFSPCINAVNGRRGYSKA